MKRLKEIFKDKKLYIFLAISLLFFGMLSRTNYSVDTYLLFASKDFSYLSEFIRSGRLITAAFFKLMQLMRFGINAMYVTSFILAIISVTLSMYFVCDLLSKNIKNKLACVLVSTLIIINPFIIELWLFAEMGIMMLSILACVLAARQINAYIQLENKKHILGASIYLLLALFCYQGTVGIFVLLSALVIILNSRSRKEFIKNNIVTLICYGIPTIINFIVVKLIGNSRVNSNYDFNKIIDFIIRASKEQLMNAFGLLPNGVFSLINLIAIWLVVVIILLNYKNVLVKKNNKELLENNSIIRDLLFILYLIVVGYIFTIITVIPQNIESAVMFARTSYAFGSIVAILFAYALVNINKFKDKSKANIVIILFSILLLIIQIISIWKIEINRYKVNKLDKEIVLKINDKIEKYEKDTGNKITKLAVYNLDKSTKFYNGLNDNINVSAKSEMPSCLALLVFYTRRQIKQVENNKEIYDTHFKNTRWNYFDLDQVYLDGDTIHWYIY